MLHRILSREADDSEKHEALEKLKVGVIGISESSGVSFLTGCLARYLANTGNYRPAVIELGHGSLYDSFGMDKRFAGREFFRFYRALSENQSIRGIRNMDEGINWILIAPDEEKIDISSELKFRMITQAKGDVILCDFSGFVDQDFRLLQTMDQIIAVIDPLPSRMLKGYETLRGIKVLEMRQNDIIYIINKLNKGVNRRQMYDYLKIKKPVTVPLISPEQVYTAEYNCKIPYSMAEIKKVLKEPLSEIISLLNF